MAITTCPNCGKTTSNMETNCLHCGAPLAARAADVKFDRPKSRFFLKKLWRGEYSLPVAFWLFYFLVNFILNATAYRAPYFYFSLLGMESNRWIVMMPLFLTVYFAYLAICVVGVWRSAGKYRGAKAWAFLARLYVVLSAFSTVNTAYNVLLLPFIQLLHVYFISA